MRPFSLSSFQIVLIGLGVTLVTCDAFASNEVYALTTFRKGIYEDPSLVLSNWNPLNSTPCAWTGIYCSKARDHVTKINITGASLKGVLASELHLISYLEELILHGNYLNGKIPEELGMLKRLKVLDLGVNRLAGPIPPEIGNLSSILKLNLQSNGFTGRLPPELSNLKHLQELKLDRNRFQGTVPGSNNSDYVSNVRGMYASNVNSPGFCGSSTLKIADFSYNFFIGGIPKCLFYLPRTSFQGNCLKDKDPKQRPPAQCGDNGSPPSKSQPRVNSKHQPFRDRPKPKHEVASKPTWLLALEMVTGIMVGSILLVALLTAIQKCKSKSSVIIPWKKSTSEKDQLSIYIDSDILKDVMRFSRQELEVACEDFSNIIGSSPDSLVYKGNIKGGPEIAVVSLCIKEEHWTSGLELYFQREAADLARLNHENAGRLLGYCRESTPFTRMLVFEYASNGTLYEHLHYGDGCHFSWTRRMKIVIGIAKGLKYLHTEVEPPFTISELNSDAVYLTEDFSPKLLGFESWKTVLSRSEKNSSTFSNEGATCVSNPLAGRPLDIQGNIYAFGVLLLEIISGRPAYCSDKGCIVDWAKEYLELPEVMPYVVDAELKHFRYEDLKTICEVVSLCIDPSLNKQVSMQEICTLLEGGIDTSISADLQASSLAWAELALLS